MKMVKGLTKANCEKYGIRVAPEYDFTDDGNKFRGFEWNGLPMSQCRADGECYLTIRSDRLHNSFTYKEWMATEEATLEDEFNGVTEFDIDKLMENLKRVRVKVDEMNAQTAVATEEEKAKYKEMIQKDIAKAEEVREKIKDIKWWKLSKWDLQWFAERIRILEDRLADAYKINPEETRRQTIAFALERGCSFVDTKGIEEDIEKYSKL